VLRFSLGFGPRLFGFKRGDTDYCLSLIPLGVCQDAGEELGEEIEEEQRSTSFSFNRFPSALPLYWQVRFQFPSAIVIFAFIYALSGIPQLTPESFSQCGSPAEKAGLMPGDKVTVINGKAIGDWRSFPDSLKNWENSR